MLIIPLTLKNRIKMKLQNLYVDFKQIFIGKTLTYKEKALEAFLDPTLEGPLPTIKPIFGQYKYRNNTYIYIKNISNPKEVK